MEEDPLGLLAGETSMLLLSAFYLVVDVLTLHRWSFFFRVIGLNPITIYLAVKMSHFNYTSRFFFSGRSGWCGSYGPPFLLPERSYWNGCLFGRCTKMIFLKV